jgi:basic amino acid/polyamine antiporter, APA family
MAERQLHGLQRVLGVNALFSTAYGTLGSSIYYALGLVAAYALGLTPLVFLIAGAFFFCTAATYAEATAMYPEAGGSSSFARRAFDERVSFFAAWAQLLTYIVTVAIAAFFVPHYLGALVWEPLRSSPGDIVFGAVVIALLVAVNVRGVRESAGLNVVLAAVDFLTQLALVAVGAALVLSPETLVDNVDFGTAPTWSQFLLAIPIAMIAYTGIETISNMAEEARDETRTIPQAINRVRLAVFAIYFTLPAVALSALPVVEREGERVTLLGLPEDEGGFAGDPILGVVEALDLGPLDAAAAVYVGLLAATILLAATNAALIGVSRLVYSMGMHRQVPDRLRRLHPRHGTPWIGIALSGLVAVLALLPGDARVLGSLYAFGATLSFTIAHASVVALRVRRPDEPRPYRGPGNLRVRGVEVPLFAVAGGLGTGLAFAVVVVLHWQVALVGTGWLAAGTALYVVFRRGQGLDLTSRHVVAVPAPVVAREAEYESVVVALDARSYSPGAVALAVRMAARRRRGIYVVVPIAVPQSSPIDADMPRQELAAQAVIEQARLQGGRRVAGRWEKVRPGQEGRLLVDTARELRARAVVLALSRDRQGHAFNRAAETVLAERPCRVIVYAGPPEARPAAAPARPA